MLVGAPKLGVGANWFEAAGAEPSADDERPNELADGARRVDDEFPKGSALEQNGALAGVIAAADSDDEALNEAAGNVIGADDPNPLVDAPAPADNDEPNAGVDEPKAADDDVPNGLVAGWLDVVGAANENAGAAAGVDAFLTAVFLTSAIFDPNVNDPGDGFDAPKEAADA